MKKLIVGFTVWAVAMIVVFMVTSVALAGPGNISVISTPIPDSDQVMLKARWDASAQGSYSFDHYEVFLINLSEVAEEDTDLQRTVPIYSYIAQYKVKVEADTVYSLTIRVMDMDYGHSTFSETVYIMTNDNAVVENLIQ